MEDNEEWIKNTALLDDVSRRVESEHASRMADVKAYLRNYYDRPVVDTRYEHKSAALDVHSHIHREPGENVTAEVVDAACAIVCRQMGVEVLPKGAKEKLEQGCKSAARLIEGVIDNSEFLAHAKKAWRDACTGDVGAVKFWVDESKAEIRCERLNPLEVFWVDDGTEDPRTLLHIAGVSRSVLASKFPEHDKAIREASAYVRPTVVGVDAPGSRKKRDANSVRVVEGWAKAIGEKGKKGYQAGRHAIVLGKTILFEEEWVHDTAPVALGRWSDDFDGPGGRSLARIVAKDDAVVRRNMSKVDRALDGVVPRVVCHEDSEVEGVSDQEYEVLKWSGPVEPKIVAPQVVSPDLLARTERAYARAYAKAGVNQNMATGSAPSRYTSGAAQREFVDIANTRLLDAQQQWERFWRAAGRIIVMLAQQARKVHVRVEGADYYEAVQWPNLDRDSYQLSFGLTSGLSLTPSGRLQELKDLQEMGLADTADVARNLNLPDTRKLADRLNAPRDLIMRQISRALDDNVFEMPSALQDLPTLVRIAGEEYQRARVRGTYPPENMDKLRKLIRAAQARLDAMAPPPAPVAAVPPMGAPLPGEPPPGAPPDLGAPPMPEMPGAPVPVAA